MAHRRGADAGAGAEAGPGHAGRAVLFPVRRADSVWRGGGGVHEALEFDRFRQGWMKWVLAVRVWKRG